MENINQKITIAVTGATGQDGSIMIDLLAKNKTAFVYGLCKDVNKKKNIQRALDANNFELIGLDIVNFQAVVDFIKKIKPDYFINFAGNSSMTDSWLDPHEDMQVNAIGVLNILEAIKSHSPHTKFFNAGSSEQFGDIHYSPQDLKHPFNPKSPYGVSKCAAHHLVKVYRESYNLYAVQGILFNHEGTRRGEEFVTRKITKGVARIKKALVNKQPFDPIELGNIYSKRDWSDAEDFVEGIWLMLNQTTPKDYILSSGETHTIKEFIENAFNCAGIDGGWVGEGLEEEYVIANYILECCGAIQTPVLVKINPIYYRSTEDNLLLGDLKKTEQEIGWKPKTPFKQLVYKMVNSDLL